MTPLTFEADNSAHWQALEAALDLAEGGKKFDAARLAALYRGCCEHLALAQARAYPIHLTQRLESLTQRAHRLIYRQHDFGLGRLRQLLLLDFPAAVRAHRWYVLVATLLFVGPLLAAAMATWNDPGFILHLLSADKVRDFDSMYGDASEALGRTRKADTDWQMFGYYIMNNIGIGFQCFGAGIFAGLGTAFFLVFNGLSIGAVGAYLVVSGRGENFLSFVVTHSAFELTAIVLASAAGLRLGHALLAPGELTRLQALKKAASDAVVLVYGFAAMLLVAAGVEAFWSSARWVSPQVKYGVGAACWCLVLAYLAFQGRPATPKKAAHAS